MELQVVGGGLAGLIAAVEAAERGTQVRLSEAHAELGGRARTSGSPRGARGSARPLPRRGDLGLAGAPGAGRRHRRRPRPRPGGGPVVLAVPLASARLLLGDDGLRQPTGATALVDVAVQAGRRDAFVVSDIDTGGWFERFSLPDPSLAPPGESLVQAQVPFGPDDRRDAALRRVEALLDAGLPGWRDRLTWRRDALARGRTGAVDMPGRTWRDRPAIDRGSDVFLAGDEVAAPGMLSEVSCTSAVAAVDAALSRVRPGRPPS